MLGIWKCPLGCLILHLKRVGEHSNLGIFYFGDYHKHPFIAVSSIVYNTKNHYNQRCNNLKKLPILYLNTSSLKEFLFWSMENESTIQMISNSW